MTAAPTVDMFGRTVHETPAEAMVRTAVDRAPMLAGLDVTSRAFAARRDGLPDELDTLAAVLLETDANPALSEAIVEGYMTRRLEAAYAAGVQDGQRRRAAAESLMRDFS